MIPSLDIVASRAGPAWPGSESESPAAPFFALVAAAVNWRALLAAGRRQQPQG